MDFFSKFSRSYRSQQYSRAACHGHIFLFSPKAKNQSFEPQPFFQTLKLETDSSSSIFLRHVDCFLSPSQSSSPLFFMLDKLKNSPNIYKFQAEYSIYLSFFFIVASFAPQTVALFFSKSHTFFGGWWGMARRVCEVGGKGSIIFD